MRNILSALTTLARLRRIQLRPGWSDPAHHMPNEGGDENVLEAVAEQIGWPRPHRMVSVPTAHLFPLLAYHIQHGWVVAERLDDNRRVTVVLDDCREQWLLDGDVTFYDIAIPEPPSEKQYKNAFAVFWESISRRKHPIVIAIIATIVINMIALATSIFSMQVYDRVIPRGSFSTLWVLSLGVIVALGFDFILRIMRARLLEIEAVQIDREVSEYFFARATSVRLDARPPSIGTLAAQLKGLEQIRSTMSSATIFAIADLPFALFFIFIVFQLGGIIALVMIVSFVVSMMIATLLARLIRGDSQKVQVSSYRKNGLLVEALDSAETIKANRGHWYFLARWNRLNEDLNEAELPVKDLQSIAGSVFGSVQQVAYVALISWGAVEVYNNKMTMGALIACSILAGRINGPLIGQLPSMVLGWTYTRISLGMLDGIMALAPDKPAGVEQLRPSRLRGAISLREMTFVHAGAKVGINVPKFEVVAGERIGVIGGIGSGKSTLLRLVAGLYAPCEGQVLLDGLDATLIADDVLRTHIGYLPQEYRLVNGTLRDNLLLGIADPGDDALMAAAELTGLDQLIRAHPLGIDLPISEGGRGLSGGQRVLAGLTRLMLTNPAIWLLDEPTSNLDVDTEARVLKAIQEKLRPGQTLILVTHKLQLLSMVDRVVLMGNGQLQLDGPTNQVIARLTPKPQVEPPRAAPSPVKTVPAVSAM